MRAKNPDVVTLPAQLRKHGYISAGTGKIYDPSCVDDKNTCDEVSWSISFRHAKYPVVAGLNRKRVTAALDVLDTDLIDGQIRLNPDYS